MVAEIFVQKLLHGNPTPAAQDLQPVGKWRPLSVNGDAVCEHSVAYSANGKLLIAGWSESVCMSWRPAEDYQTPTPLGHGENFSLPWSAAGGVAVDGEGKVVLTGRIGCWQLSHGSPAYYYDRSAHVWSASDGKEIIELHVGSESARSVAISNDGRIGVTEHETSISIWDLSNGREIHRFGELDRDHDFRRIALSPNGNCLATLAGNDIVVWNTQTFEEIYRLSSPASRPNPISVTLSTDGKMLLWGGLDGNVHFVEVNSQKEIGEAKTQSPWAKVALSSDDKFFAVYVHDAADGKSDSHCLVGEVGTKSWIARSPAIGQRILSISLCASRHEVAAGTDHNVLIWNWNG